MKIIRISFIISFVLFSVITYSQENPRIKRSEFKKTEEGFKIAWKNLKEGDKYYKAGKGTYRLALEKYWTAFEYNETSAALNYKIGVCYLFTGKDRVKARDHLQKAYEIDPYVATDINYLLGRAYHLNLEFDKAIDEYKKYKSSLSEVYNENKITRLGLYDKIDKRIKECKYGMELVEKPQRVIIKDISDNINTVYDEYNSIFTP